MKQQKRSAMHLEQMDRKRMLAIHEYIFMKDTEEFAVLTAVKRRISNWFVDAWINKPNHGDIMLNKVWSKRAIEQKIVNERKRLKKNFNLRNEHTVPKAVFEDIFIDGEKIDSSQLKLTTRQQQMMTNLQFFNALQKKNQTLTSPDFLHGFFDEFCTTTTLRLDEDQALLYRTGMPDEFFTTYNKWTRYRHFKKDITIKAIILYHCNFSDLKRKSIDWETATIETLQSKGIVGSQIIIDDYIPFQQEQL